MIDISQLPAVRAQLERDVAAAQAQQQAAPPAAQQFARAPAAAGEQLAQARHQVQERVRL